MDIPENVKVTKNTPFDGWCYPFNTKEFLEAFHKTKLPIKIYYDNSKNEGYSLDKGFRIFSAIYHGTRSNTGNYIIVNASTIKRKYKPLVHKTLFREVIPIVNKWMESVINEKVIQLTSYVEVVYQNYIRFRNSHCIKILTNAKRPNWRKHVIWIKEINLEKEIEIIDKETTEKKKERQTKDFIKLVKKYREKKDNSLKKFYEEVKLIRLEEKKKKLLEEDKAWEEYYKQGE